jgi:hypothetical protein
MAVIVCLKVLPVSNGESKLISLIKTERRMRNKMNSLSGFLRVCIAPVLALDGLRAGVLASMNF